MNKRTSFAVKTVIFVFFAILCFTWIYPFLWMISASFKTTTELFKNGLKLMPNRFSFDSYVRAWVKGNFGRYFLNSVIVTLGTILVVVVRCSMAGYVLALYNFKGKKLILAVLMATFLIPTGTTIIPTVELSQKLGLLNSRIGVILALGGAGNVASLLLYKATFEGVPQSLSEAAEIDGAGFFSTFFHVMVPMSGPVTATTVILTFMTAWNNFMIPLVFTFGAANYRTLPVGMMAFQGANETDWAGMAAAGTITIVPIIIVFMCLQKFFINGIAGAVKE